MSIASRDLPADSHESFGDDLVGMGSFFVDPSGAARCVHRKWFWIGPLVVFSVLSVIASHTLMPLVQHALETSPVPANTTPERYARGVQMALTMQRALMYLAPLFILGKFALEAAVLLGVSSITGVNAKFRPLLNLVAGCGLIEALASIATMIILHAKGEISSMAELRPPLGLDIFLSEGTSKLITTAVGFFSVFEIWWIVMAVLIYSVAFRTSKGKAALAVLCLEFVALAIRLVGVAFQPG